MHNIVQTTDFKWNLYILSIAKDTRKWLNPCTAPKSTRLFLPCSISTKARSNHKWSIPATSGPEHPKTYFLALAEFRSVCRDLWVMKHFLPFSPTVETLLTSQYSTFHGRCLGELHSLVLLLHVFRTYSFRKCS